ncbi:MAG: hypothetical protein ACOYOS_00180 [Syntrophales bacterium]
MVEGTVADRTMVPSINVLKASELVTQDDVLFLQAHAEQFENRFRTRAIYRSVSEIEGGVLNDDEHPTPDSKYWQAIGEQNVQLTELITLDFERKKFGIDTDMLIGEIEELEHELANVVPSDTSRFLQRKLELEMQKKKVQVEQNKFGMTQMNKTAQERMREVREWEPIIEALIPQLKYGTETFGLHHPERYYLRYKRRMDNLNLVDPEARESVVSHTKAFEKQVSGATPLPAPAKANIPPGLPPVSSQVDYKDKKDMDKDDAIAKKYFDRKVRTIRVVAPHRAQGDTNATNFHTLQPPAGFNMELMEPYGYTIPDARNYAVQEAIKDGMDYILFVDDDTILPRMALVKMVKWDTDVVGGLYYRKYFPVETVSMHETTDGQPCSIDNYAIGDVIHDTLVLASGCSLVKVSALKKIEFPWYKIITVNGRPTLTEDTYFCQKAKDVGIDLITDTGIQCLHVDKTKGILYGHPDIVDFEKNEIRVEYRDHFAV